MALHFERKEFDQRIKATQKKLQEQELDGLLMFAQESMYYLTGYDTFGFCFFQCLYLDVHGNLSLLTRSADLRQAEHTSIINDIRIWTDEGGAQPAQQLKSMLSDMGAEGYRLGVEYATVGLTAANGKAVDAALDGFAELSDASDLVNELRRIKSPAELEYVRKAGELADLAYNAAVRTIGPGVDEGVILAAMHSAIFEAGGDYAGNEFIIGSGRDALLCRYKTGRAVLRSEDQITLEWAGAYRHYHAAMMRTAVVGRPTARHEELHSAAIQALRACEEVIKPGKTAGDVFDAHARVMDSAGLEEHRLNACGYSLGARYTPCWMDWPMFYSGNPTVIESGMVFFAHMIIADSISNTAMTLGRSYIVTDDGIEHLSKSPMELIIK